MITVMQIAYFQEYCLFLRALSIDRVQSPVDRLVVCDPFVTVCLSLSNSSSLCLVNLTGQGNLVKGVECASCECARDCLWGYSWTILRSFRAFSHRRSVSGDELPVHGRLRRSGILLVRNCHPVGGAQSAIQKQDHNSSR